MKTAKKFIAAALALVFVLCVFSACDLIPQSKQLIGSWRDSTGTCGYEFKDDNTVVITYADFTIPILNIKYTGVVDGTYKTYEDDAKVNHISITCTIFTKSLTWEYTYAVEKGSLSLTSENGDTTVLIKQDATATSAATTTAAAAQ